jgi:hypothetical protein
MKIFLIKILNVFAVLLFGGCYVSTYVPTTISTPLLKSVDEYHVSGGLSGSSSYSGQFSFSPMPNVGMIFNANINKKNDVNLGKIIYDSHLNGEIGVGYYYVFTNTVYEGYAGYGHTNSDVKELSDWFSSVESKGKYQSIFLLQNYGGVIDSLLEAIASIKITGLKYYSYTSAKTITKNNRLSTLMIEPALTIKYGWPSFKFVYQMLYSHSIYDDVVFNINPFIATLGIEVIFPIKH